MKLYELLIACAAITTALGVIGGGVVWLVWPRIRAAIEQVATGVSRVESKLEDRPDTVGRHAKVAAAAIPEIRSDLAELRGDVATLTENQKGLDEWRERTERRLTSVEGALLALLGPELRKRLVDDFGESMHDHDH